MCVCKVQQSRLLLSSWTSLGASGTEKQSGTQDASGKCSSWDSTTPLIGWQLGALCKLPLTRQLRLQRVFPPTRPNPGQCSSTDCFFFFFFAYWPEFKSNAKVEGIHDAKIAQKFGRGKGATVAQENCLPKFRLKVWKTRCVFLSLQGRGNALGEVRFQTSVILEDGRHGVLFTSSNRCPGKLCSFLILSVEEFAWTPVRPGLGSLDRSGI